ncbi:unnamed protein product [Fraxinus pennsylvanica]|uniref:Uncharacterized protein n=1 Tax=Fraxinus pennsylvanica TaxID=56036 RepID=A0AAD2AHH8_9LAMI|nr:unnamed protein product [Fraxinus pennsylvanica]
MVSLNYLSITRPYIIASSLPNDTPPSLPHSNSLPRTNNSTPPQFHQQEKLKRKQRQLSVAEIERAIGAGIFRENDTNRESEVNKHLFDSILANSVGKDEGSAEKKLRETGEWIIDQTERTSRSSESELEFYAYLLLETYKVTVCCTERPGDSLISLGDLFSLEEENDGDEDDDSETEKDHNHFETCKSKSPRRELRLGIDTGGFHESLLFS